MQQSVFLEIRKEWFWLKDDETKKSEHKTLEELFKNYDKSQPYPCEIVDKGGAVGEELI